MMEFVIPQGELKKIAQQYHDKVDDNVEIQIITLQQWLYEKTLDTVYNITDFAHITKLIERHHPQIREFVDIDTDKIVIGINAEKINNDNVNNALSLLTSIEDLKKVKKYEFGQSINTEKLVELIDHI
jgi:hypothetical protein